jgi:hypothetical protein
MITTTIEKQFVSDLYFGITFFVVPVFITRFAVELPLLSGDFLDTDDPTISYQKTSNL